MRMDADRGLLQLSVLDQTPLFSGWTPTQGLDETLALAQLAERWGYHRYWLAEHHNAPGRMGTAPEILVAAVAAATGRIRVGAGGMMLPLHSALKVAETFRLLEALHPGRVDLGIGRARGADPAAVRALRGSRGRVDYREQIRQLLGFLNDTTPDGDLDAGVRAAVWEGGVPPVWILASGQTGIECAASLGTAMSFAHFAAPSDGPALVARYRSGFMPGPSGQVPTVNVALRVVCADSESAAHQLVAKEFASETSIDENLAMVKAKTAMADGRLQVGAPEQVRERLDELARSYQTSEFVVLTTGPDHALRRRSYELLSEICELDGCGPQADL
jgi:luciferase family oxidoreductase group 1